MNSPETKTARPEPPHIAAQVAATWAGLDAAGRVHELAEALANQDRAFLSAMREMQAIRDFVGSPEHILGSGLTKHGEIAEYVTVHVSRAKDVLLGNVPGATFEGVGRIDATDYRFDGADIQSKYHNGLRNTLDAVLRHAGNHPEFTRSGAGYHIPRDQHEELSQGIEEGGGAIQDRLEQLQRLTGRPAEDIIKPGEATYSEVQQGRVHDTIRDRENSLTRRNEELREAARSRHEPSVAGFGTAAVIGATVGGGVALTQGIWVKYREGKNPFRGDFSLQDWQDIGVPVAQGAGAGGIAGGALYLLTNSTKLSAPAAGAFVSGLMGIGSLLRQYHAGYIDGERFVDLSQMAVVDAATVGVASATGQLFIPVPLLGAFIGSVAGKFVATTLSNVLDEDEAKLKGQLHAHADLAYAQLDEECQAYLRRLDDHFDNLERLAVVAFDTNVNTDLLLKASVELAEAVGVEEELILRSTADLDKFMTEQS